MSPAAESELRGRLPGSAADPTFCAFLRSGRAGVLPHSKARIDVPPRLGRGRGWTPFQLAAALGPRYSEGRGPGTQKSTSQGEGSHVHYSASTDEWFLTHGHRRSLNWTGIE